MGVNPPGKAELGKNTNITAGEKEKTKKKKKKVKSENKT
jgi:hypothetical protein